MGCRAHNELEAEKLSCEIAELENSVVHLVSECVCVCIIPSPFATPLMPIIKSHTHTHTLSSTQKSSNDELTKALAAAPNDVDFQDALQENKTVIQKKENLIEQLKKELRGIKSTIVNPGAVHAVAQGLLQVPVPLSSSPPSTTTPAVPPAAATVATEGMVDQVGAEPSPEEGEEGEEKEG